METISPPASGNYRALIRNKSGETLQVTLRDKENDQFKFGFGLGSRSNTSVPVTANDILLLGNEGDPQIKASVKFYELKPGESLPGAPQQQRPPRQPRISFVLHNATAKSIPLIIPSVMNPNLSPFSSSGVDLEIGQEILFREKGKRHVLLVVDEDIQAGEKINVAKLLRERRKALGLTN
ncbi:MAG: hypothetical protein AAGA85_19015 [Bacteroidota bacterium]